MKKPHFFFAALLAAFAIPTFAFADGPQCPTGQWSLTWSNCRPAPAQAAPKPKVRRPHRQPAQTYVAPASVLPQAYASAAMPAHVPPFPVVPGPVANGCPAGFGVRFHVYPLRLLYQQRPDLYARAMQLVAASTERQRQGLGYAGLDFSRTLGATLRRTWGVHADVRMSVEVRYLDPHTKQVTSHVGTLHVEHGIGDLRLPGDPRRYITEFVLPWGQYKIVTEPTPIIRDLPNEWPDCLQNVSVGIYEDPSPGV